MSNKRHCYYIPRDSFVEGKGYRVAIVTENKAGYAFTGTWPYTGARGETLPYFWGKRDEPDTNANYERACKTATDLNAEMGHTADDVVKIIASSMGKCSSRKAAQG